MRVLEQAIVVASRTAARSGIIGVPADPTAALPVGLIQAQMLGATITGIVEGDSVPDVFIPELLELHKAGTVPVRQARHHDAVRRASTTPSHAQHRGEAVKIVLVHD